LTLKSDFADSNKDKNSKIPIRDKTKSLKRDSPMRDAKKDGKSKLPIWGGTKSISQQHWKPSYI
jgi:hypothetical protein